MPSLICLERALAWYVSLYELLSHLDSYTYLTPSSGLDSWAWQGLTLFWRSNNILSFRSLPPLSSLLKPNSFGIGKTSMTFFVVMLITGNPSSALMATHPLSTWVPSYILIARLLLLLSNLPLTTPSLLPTWISSM